MKVHSIEIVKFTPLYPTPVVAILHSHQACHDHSECCLLMDHHRLKFISTPGLRNVQLYNIIFQRPQFPFIAIGSAAQFTIDRFLFFNPFFHTVDMHVLDCPGA
jgi:hypothetical protein